MRLWHYKLIPFLPNKQLIGQWSELNSIFKEQPKHILINYIYECRKDDLILYARLVLAEKRKRHLKTLFLDKFLNYFYENREKGDYRSIEGILNSDSLHQDIDAKFIEENASPKFLQYQNNRYLRQCFFNLQEKYDRGQKDFSKEQYDRLEAFVRNELVIDRGRNLKMKPVIYSTTEKKEVLAEGDYNGRHYCIVWCKTHPTAYVEFKDEKIIDCVENLDAPCHGGITYNGSAYWNKDDHRKYIGWDYAHYEDYVCSYIEYPEWLGEDNNLKKWTIEEVFEEVKKTIDYLNNIKKGNKENE